MSVLPPIMAFVDLVRENASHGMRVAEVGVYDGTTSFAYADIIKQHEGHLYLVDWFKGNENLFEGHHKYQEDGDPLYREVVGEIERRGLKNHVTVLYGRSTDMARMIEDRSLDICFLDADHSYKGCSSDIESYYPKVKMGGILCGHDCEDINISHLFRPEDMLVDHIMEKETSERGITSVTSCHPGVITAVYKKFGNQVKVIHDPKGQGAPIWVKRVGDSIER